MDQLCDWRVILSVLVGAGSIALLKKIFGNKKVKSHRCIKAHDKLSAHNSEFEKKQVIEVTKGVWVAIGYGLANTIMIEGKQGVIIVDCMESNEAAVCAMEAFLTVCRKPVVAIVYTHNHTDHIGGVKAFLRYANNGRCDIFAHRTTAHLIKKFMGKTGTVGFIRGARQFGQYLSRGQHINSGIGPCLVFDENTVIEYVMPTITFDKVLEVTVEGVLLRMLHAPGETDDQIVVHLPEKEVLCAADNIYKAFPNLYAIRGTPTRDAKQWADSLDLMKSCNAEFLVPSHTQPLVGRQTIADTFDAYRDAVLFVHDQTVRLMNKGYFVDDIVPMVTLPPHLIDHPYLQEFYGTVAWSVRGVFNQYLGWFGGDPAYLHPLPPPEYARRMVKLAGGALRLIETASEALADGDAQWALHCAQAVLRSHDEALMGSSLHNQAKAIAVEALEALASTQVSANGRNYYLTYARELDGSLPGLKPSPKQIEAACKELGAVDIMLMLPLRLKADKCHDVSGKIVYQFSDIKRAVAVTIRRGVAEALEVPFSDSSAPQLAEGADVVATVTAAHFVEIAALRRNKTTTVLSGDMVVEGKGAMSSLFLKNFMDHFDDSATPFKAPL